MEQNHKPLREEIGVLYGARVMMIAFVASFHFYQQSWLGRSVTLFGQTLDLTPFAYSGFLFVDGLLLLSAFLLYLPYAREKEDGIPVSGVWDFYYRRIRRILPSYWFAILVSFFAVALPQGSYSSIGEAIKDLAAHLTFLQMFNRDTYLFSPLNGAVWTIAVEMQFYLLFPLLARCVQKKPMLTLGILMLLGWAYRWLVCSFAEDTAPLVNQMPAFLDVYALGMLGAILYIRGKKSFERLSASNRRIVRSVASAVFVLLCIVAFRLVVFQTSSNINGYEAIRHSQMKLRFPFALTILCCMLCAAAAWKPFRFMLDNRLMRYLSSLSMNFYIWHQLLAVQIHTLWIPDMDALHADPNRQILYTLLCWLTAFAASMLITNAVEKPCAHLLDLWQQSQERKEFSDERPKT